MALHQNWRGGAWLLPHKAAPCPPHRPPRFAGASRAPVPGPPGGLGGRQPHVRSADGSGVRQAVPGPGPAQRRLQPGGVPDGEVHRRERAPVPAGPVREPQVRGRRVRAVPAGLPRDGGVPAGLPGAAMPGPEGCAVGRGTGWQWQACAEFVLASIPPPPPRVALEKKRPQRRPQERLSWRLEEVAKAVGGSYSRLQMPLKLALAVRETVADEAEQTRAIPPSH